MSRSTPGRFASDAQAAWYGGQFTAEQSAAARTQRRRGKNAATPAPDGPPPLPQGGDPAWGVPVYGRDLVVGDVIVHLGRHYPVDRFESYSGGLAAELGAGARTAYSGDWGMAVGPNRVIRILPREGS
ncbi:hypothetical protein ACGF0J_21745 [Nonomuraea sp. NPDC047897]|uniref:hypothetical protein n=1 Tax=Nonomuraea sp. NPDC047897 TaxID=3364346 RepID=UPI00371B9064